MENEVTKDYWGMADCHGLSSFIEAPHEGWNEWGGGDTGSQEVEAMKEGIAGAIMSARANPQRWTVVYKAEVRVTDAEILEEILKINSFEALKCLKKCAVKVQIAKTGGVNTTRLWEAIPNHKLDPGYNG